MELTSDLKQKISNKKFQNVWKPNWPQTLKNETNFDNFGTFSLLFSYYFRLVLQIWMASLADKSAFFNVFFDFLLHKNRVLCGDTFQEFYSSIRASFSRPKLEPMLMGNNVRFVYANSTKRRVINLEQHKRFLELRSTPSSFRFSLWFASPMLENPATKNIILSWMCIQSTAHFQYLVHFECFLAEILWRVEKPHSWNTQHSPKFRLRIFTAGAARWPL